MCGPFVLAIGGASPGWRSALARQVAFTAGRIFTYGVLGAVAGYCGSRLSSLTPALVNLPALLAIATSDPHTMLGAGQTFALQVPQHRLRGQLTPRGKLAQVRHVLLMEAVLDGDFSTTALKKSDAKA